MNGSSNEYAPRGLRGFGGSICVIGLLLTVISEPRASREGGGGEVSALGGDGNGVGDEDGDGGVGDWVRKAKERTGRGRQELMGTNGKNGEERIERGVMNGEERSETRESRGNGEKWRKWGEIGRG